MNLSMIRIALVLFANFSSHMRKPAVARRQEIASTVDFMRKHCFLAVTETHQHNVSVISPPTFTRTVIIVFSSPFISLQHLPPSSAIFSSEPGLLSCTNQPAMCVCVYGKMGEGFKVRRRRRWGACVYLWIRSFVPENDADAAAVVVVVSVV